MKRMMLLFLAVCWIAASSGQTLHAILFADTNDQSVGDCDYQDYLNISMEVNTIASAIGMRLKPYYYKGTDCSNANLLRVLANLHTNKDDVVVFYYTGHGARSSGDSSKYPQMCLASNYDSDFYPLEGVLNQLKRQKARLKIVIGDCCNSVVPGVSPKDAASKGATVLTKEPVNSYRNLFFGNEGIIIVSSSKSGETSAAVCYSDGRPAGGAFTISLLNVLQAVAKKGLDAGWEDILASARNLTRERRKHTPVYDIALKPLAVASADAAPQNTTVADAPRPDSQRKFENIEILTAIANENMPVEKRVEIKDVALKELFASPTAKVEIVGRNGITIVATETAQDFILRLSTAHRLLRLVELAKKVDAHGRYEYLRVHEIYSGY